MTRDKAIEIVKSAFSAWKSEFRAPNEDWSEEHEALNMAIEALKTDIVLCGECSYMMPDGRCCVFADDAIRPSVSDFCSYGERSEE